MPPRSARRQIEQPDEEALSELRRGVRRLVSARRAASTTVSPHLTAATAALALADAADWLARSEVMAARDEDRATWEQVGEALGISKQGAFERFRTGPGGMHSRLFAQKAAQSSSKSSGSDGGRGAAVSKARKASRTRS